MENLGLASLVPVIRNQRLVRDHLRNSTFVGIDFGTSTTVASYAVIGDETKPITTETIPIPQHLEDGRIYESHLVPSAIAWYNDQLFIGAGAAELKSRLIKGKNVWFSFKMELGVDLGPQYYNTELPRGHRIATIETPQDATTVFFLYLKQHIEDYICRQGLPQYIKYSVSIPASFEANQRRDLLEALKRTGISLPQQVFIDEPNAAFLSYLAESNINNLGGFQVPRDSPLHILVFDFGAGTCDISILEIGKRLNDYYSKNMAISRFEALGGDDIDRAIIRSILISQLFRQNGCSEDDFKTPDINKRIIPTLMRTAEKLKINLCKSVASQMIGPKLSSLATSDRTIRLDTTDVIQLPKRELTLKNPDLRYKDFHDVMAPFLDVEGIYNHYDEGEAVISVFTPIESALRKTELDSDNLDLILLVGGSSENPYVQAALQEYFEETEVEIPSDLRSHVSTGAALNSLLINGFGIDTIKPITSEPILVVTREGYLRTLIKAGTEIPCGEILVDDLVISEDNQRKIQLPICVSNERKILNVIKISDLDSDGFKRGTPVTVTCDVTEDKIVRVKVRVGSRDFGAVMVNPFANRELTTEERIVLEAEKNANSAAARNDGKPTLAALEQLQDAYEHAQNYLRAAETLEIIQQLDPRNRYETNICYSYSRAGKDHLSDKWAEIAYNRQKTTVNTFNLALSRLRAGQYQEFERLMEETLSMDSSASYVLEAYGNYLMRKSNSRGKEMLERAFQLLYQAFQVGILPTTDYFRLINAAENLGQHEVAQVVKSRLQAAKEECPWYKEDYLVARKSGGDIQKA